MGQRAAALADQYEQVLAELAKTVEGLPDATWRAICGDERWTVAATAHHVGAQLPLEREYITAAAEGREMPAYTWDDINGRNAQHAQDFASCTKEQALSVIRETDLRSRRTCGVSVTSSSSARLLWRWPTVLRSARSS